MFTGIVETVGKVVACGPDRLTVSASGPFAKVRLGESISVDGVCLTAQGRARGAVEFRLLPETLNASTLGGLREGSRVNLERSLRVGDRLGGHLLLGHVDARGVVARRTRRGQSLTLEIRVPEGLARLLVPKGPIAVDGVSLTLDGKVGADRIRVHLVSHTLKATTLGEKPEGGQVNLEVDLVAKYLRGMLS